MNHGKKIKKLRKESKLSETDLGIKSGVSRTTIREIEKGTYSSRISTLENIYKVFNKVLKVVDDE